MSETDVAGIVQRPENSMAGYFSLDPGVPPEHLKDFFELQTIFDKNGIDAETRIGILRSFEASAGTLDDPKLRITRALRFLRGCGTSKEGLLDTVKSMGYYSKEELEQYARETGDWSHFLKRIETEKKK